jgi:hypothetical protein
MDAHAPRLSHARGCDAGRVPFTFLAHQAPALPFKLLRPAWFSGTGLVIGSMAPDLEYFLRGDVVSRVGHTPLGLVAFCVPISVALTLVVRRVAPTIAAHLPDLPPLHLKDYALVARDPLPLVALSALAGALTHVAWDGFTHGDGWAVERLPALATDLGPVKLWKALQHGSTLVGAAITLWLMSIIGRRRLLRAWSGAESPAVAISHARLWTPAIVLALAGIAWAALGATPDDPALRTAVRAFQRATTFGFMGRCRGAGSVRARAATTGA